LYIGLEKAVKAYLKALGSRPQAKKRARASRTAVAKKRKSLRPEMFLNRGPDLTPAGSDGRGGIAPHPHAGEHFSSRVSDQQTPVTRKTTLSGIDCSLNFRNFRQRRALAHTHVLKNLGNSPHAAKLAQWPSGLGHHAHDQERSDKSVAGRG